MRTIVIAAGLAVTVASALAIRGEDWPVYVTFLLLWLALNPPEVEVLPRMSLPVANLATTIGFLYIAGPPIIVLQFAALTLVASLPQSLRVRLGVRHFGRVGVQHHRSGATMLAEWANFTLGLGARWVVAWSLVPDGNVTAHPPVILVAEVVGYAALGLLSMLPIYSFRAFPALRPDAALRAVYGDMVVVVILTLTPFVFLIAYGYQTHGLAGASVWSLAALGPHLVLKRLNERRLRVEEQNRRLEALQRELAHRERLSAIGKMSSVVSHQILQQLGVIGLYADLIRNAPDDGDAAQRLARVRHDAGSIEDALASVSGVLRDLLVFSKDQRLNLYEHDVAAIVDDAIVSCRPAADARAITVQSAVPRDLRLTLDKLKIHQTLANVLRNALEASPPGGTVEVRARVLEDGVELRVADQGAGVPARERDAVFAPFFTTKDQGTGLGLAIAREFARAHGGDLRLAEESAAGATFVLTLPSRSAESPRRAGDAG